MKKISIKKVQITAIFMALFFFSLVKLHAQEGPKVKFTTTTIYFDASFQVNDSVHNVIKITNTGDEPLEILDVICSDESIDFTLPEDDIQPGQIAFLFLISNSGEPIKGNPTITLTTNVNGKDAKVIFKIKPVIKSKSSYKGDS